MKIKAAARIFLPPLWRFLRKTQGGSIGSTALAILAEIALKRQFGKVKPEGESKGKANKLRHLIEKIRIENKMRPSPPPLGGASPRGEAYEIG